MVGCCKMFETYWAKDDRILHTSLTGKYVQDEYFDGKQVWKGITGTGTIYWDESITGWKVY